MKKLIENKLTPLAAACILAMSATVAQAQERYVIQVDNNSKGIVKALTNRMAATLKSKAMDLSLPSLTVLAWIR
jgi:hypothetical protein